MADEVAGGGDVTSSIALAVDSTQVNRAADDLERFSRAGAGTEQTTKRVELAFDALVASTNNIAAQMRDLVTLQTASARSFQELATSTASIASLAAANARLAAEAKPAAVAMDNVADAGQRLLASLRDQSATFGKSAEDIARYRAAQAGVAAEAAPLILQLENQRSAQRAAADAAIAEAQAQREAAQAKAAVGRNQSSFIEALKFQADMLGKSQGEILAYRAALLGVSDQAAPYITRISEAAQKTGQLGAGQKLTAMQAQQLGFQLNDLFVQIASGGSPLTALIQQGSQLSGTFGGLGNTFRALGTLVTPARLALGGVGLALTVVSLAYAQGAKEGDEFARSLILTGNAAGSTVGQLTAQAKAISAVAGTQGKAAEVLAQLAATGRVGAEAIGRVAEASIRLERVGGPAAAETAKQFAELGKAPLQASIRLNEQTNFLTDSLYRQIKALEEQGKVAEAARVAQIGYAEALEGRTSQLEARLGFFERAWRTLGDAAKGAWDKILNIGRPDTPEDLVGQAEKALERARKLAKLPAFSSSPEANVEAKERELAAAKAVSRALQDDAKATADKAEAGKVLVELDKDLGKSMSYRAQLAKDLQEFDSKAAIARRAVSAERLAEFDADVARQRAFLQQSASATQQGIALELAGIEEVKKARLDASKLAEQQIKRQVALGNTSEFAADREIAALRLRDNQAIVAALQAQRRVLASQFEPAQALAANQNQINEALRERELLLDKERNVMKDLVALGERRQESPAESFRRSELQGAQAIADAQRQAQLAIVQAAQSSKVSLEESNRELALEAELIGRSSAARSIALQQFAIEAQLRARIREIQAARFSPDRELQEIADATKAAQQAIANLGTKSNLQAVSDLLDPTRAKSFAETLTAGFNSAGSALAKLSNVFADYAAKRISLEEQIARARADKNPAVSEEARQKTINALVEKQGQTQLEAYASMTTAARGFFKEGSSGYRTLSALEAAFTIAQLAGSFARSTAAATEAVLNQGKGDPYSAFARMAAMAAAVAQLGFATGFFGSSGTSNLASAADRQGGAATGRVITAADLDPNSASFVRGTVLGDSDARSESILNAIESLDSIASIELTYTRGMLDSLRNIESSLLGLGNLLFRAAGGGLTTGRNLGIQTGLLGRNEGDPILKAMGINDAGVIQSLANSGSILGKIGVFGQSLWGKVTQEVVDSGLSIIGTVADLIAGQGVQQFADVATTTSSFFGLRKKTSTSTQFAEVDDAIAEQFGLLFASIGDTIGASAAVLGRDAGQALTHAIESYPIKIDRLSLKGLEGEELQNALNAAIGAATDEMAAALVPGLNDFQRVGEGYYETLVRVASGIEVANYELELLGITAIDYAAITRKQGDVTAEIIRQSIVQFETAGGVVSSVGEIIQTLNGNGSDLSSTYRQLVDVRDALVLVGESGDSLTVAMIRGAGGLDKLSAGLDTYFTKFFTPQEQAAAKTARLADQFERLGLELPATREEFRALVESLADGTDAGERLFAAVTNLAGAFDEAIAPAEALAQTLLDSITEALPKFLSPEELLGTQYGNIAAGLQKAGINVSAGQLQAASLDDIEAFARAFVNIGDGASEAEIAVVKAASALADLKNNAAAATQQLEDAIAQNLPRLLSPDAQRTFRFQQIQADLQDVGVSIPLERLMTATKAQILAFAQSFVNLADGASKAELAVVNAAGALGTLIDESKTASDARQKTLGDQFDQLVEGLRRGVSDAYADVSQIISSEQTRLKSEADKSIQELEQKGNKVTQTYSSLIDSLGSSLKQVMGDIAGDGGRAQAINTLRLFRDGGAVDADAVRDAASTAARLETSNFASALEFRRAQASTAALIRDVSVAAQQRQTSELGAIQAQQEEIEFELKKQTDALDDQLKQARSAAGSLASIDDGVKTVAGAIDRLNQAMAAARAATGGGGPTGQWVSSGGTDALASAGGAVALRETGAKVEDSIVKGLKSSFTIAEAQAFVADRLAAGDIVGIYARARAEGIDSSTLDTLMGWAPGTSLGEALRRGLPAFEVGSDFVPNTGLAVVHQGERIFTAADNRAVMRMLSDGVGGSAEVVAAVNDLIAAVKESADRNVRGHAAVAANTGAIKKHLDGAINGGAPLRTEAVTP
jgi:phage-related minor tail protein